ncbi:MAG: hypothetical protein OK457_02745 [Thaumarchaeota archaeon]|nr:hypothetical protein [Nitrososphaerota archaeon]
MSKLRVTLEKLEKYSKNQGGYEIFLQGDRIVLSFVPVFPEALSKGDEPPPRVIMSGIVTEGKVEFNKVEIDFPEGTREREFSEAELVYKNWLDYIEDNY